MLTKGFQKKTPKTPKSEIEKALKIKYEYETEKNTKSLDQFINEQYGKKGNSKRDKFDKGYESFKLGFMIQQARLEKGMTQEELAVRLEFILFRQLFVKKNN